MIRQRVRKMARWALLKHTQLTENLTIEESLVYDGLENFAGSQFDPNQIQQAIGEDSLFIYDFNFVPLNRKGRITEQQKTRLKKIEKKLGRYPANAIRQGTSAIFSRLWERKSDRLGGLVVHSDDPFQYKKVVEQDLKDLGIRHIKTSSRKARNVQNKL